jgi:phage terminase small subunit
MAVSKKKTPAKTGTPKAKQGVKTPVEKVVPKNVLTPKQEKFCIEYMVDLNMTQAAIRAGYSKRTANEQGSRLLANVKIQTRVKELQQDTREKIELSIETVLNELKNFAFSDITETLLLTVEQVKELPEDVRRLITKYKHTTKTYINENGPDTKEDVVELWFVDKLKAFDMLNRHLGFYEEDNFQKKTEINMDLSGLSNDDLIKRAEALKTIKDSE